ncbi:MAG: thioredoxin family protein, partial [Desulfurivibrionaceae bacterium]|nr:thioredoxin family protein [Desulfurivibrionaceae bacterium]
MEIKVMGPGCAKCAETEEIVREAVNAAGIEATIEKVSDFQEMARHGVLSTPAV